MNKEYRIIKYVINYLFRRNMPRGMFLHLGMFVHLGMFLHYVEHASRHVPTSCLFLSDAADGGFEKSEASFFKSQKASRFLLGRLWRQIQ